MTKISQLQELEIVPGVMPYTDATPSDVPCWVDSLHVRFDPTTGRIRKLGGWLSNVFDLGNTINGTLRTIYSVTINGQVYTLLGTNTSLYSLIGSTLTNITPLQDDSVTVANSLATHYGTLANNPITTVLGSTNIVVADTEYGYYAPTDEYTLSGSTAVNGVPAIEINGTHGILAVGVNTITLRVTTAATSSGAGGGASVVRATGAITVTAPANGLFSGSRVLISGAASTGGVLDTEINQEFVINAETNIFTVETEGLATSHVTAGGGAATVYYPQLEPGNLNQGFVSGYGAGYYGVGLYGTALTSTTGQTYPQIWFCDRYGDNMVMTPGNQGGAYVWDGDVTTAPTLIADAPDDINYLFVSNNILVTFGHDVENKIFASDQGDITEWTSSSTNQVFEDIIEGAGRLISSAPVDGYNLIFTENQTFTFKYIGLPGIWQILSLDPSIGIIAPMARVTVNGIAYWMGQQNFYLYRGGKIEVIPSNLGVQSSMLRYVIDNLNTSQRYKIFAWHNEEFDEVWFHYPSGSSNECDQVARFSRKLQCWMPDTLDRTAGENPTISLTNPRLGNGPYLYVHEAGANDDGSPMPFSARTKKFLTGKDTAVQSQLIPDSTQTGTISAQVRTFNYPQSQTAMNDNSYSVTASTEKVPTQLNGRFWDLTISGEELNQTYLMGQWYMEPQKGATAP